MDGRSFLPLLHGEKREGRERVFTVFHQTAGRGDYPMRALRDHRFGYVFNAWSDGKLQFRDEARGSASFKAMEAAAPTNPPVAERVNYFLYRAREEFYDYQSDPAALHNLIDEPKYSSDIARFRTEMPRIMRSIGDPQLADYEQQLARVSR